MEKEILKEMDSYQLLDTLRATAKDLDFAEDFNQVYETILTRAKEKNDLRHLKKAQDLRWQQTEFLIQSWLQNYEPIFTTHEARHA